MILILIFTFVLYIFFFYYYIYYWKIINYLDIDTNIFLCFFFIKKKNNFIIRIKDWFLLLPSYFKLKKEEGDKCNCLKKYLYGSQSQNKDYMNDVFRLEIL